MALHSETHICIWGGGGGRGRNSTKLLSKPIINLKQKIDTKINPMSMVEVFL